MEWVNPIDVVSTQINVVEKEISSLSVDTDGDGVSDKFDKDNNTPQGVAVDGSGKALDVDSDGVPDYQDIDPFTAPGVTVDANGLELDSDQDGVADAFDLCPTTPEGEQPDEDGCGESEQGDEDGGTEGRAGTSARHHPLDYWVDHTTGTVMIDKNMQQRVWWGDTDWVPELFLDDLEILLAEE